MAKFTVYISLLVISIMCQQLFATHHNVSSWKDHWKKKKEKPECPLGASLTQPFFQLLDTLFPHLFVNSIDIIDTVISNNYAVITRSETIQVLNNSTLNVEEQVESVESQNENDGCCAM